MLGAGSHLGSRPAPQAPSTPAETTRRSGSPAHRPSRVRYIPMYRVLRRGHFARGAERPRHQPGRWVRGLVVCAAGCSTGPLFVSDRGVFVAGILGRFRRSAPRNREGPCAPPTELRSGGWRPPACGTSTSHVHGHGDGQGRGPLPPRRPSQLPGAASDDHPPRRYPRRSRGRHGGEVPRPAPSPGGSRKRQHPWASKVCCRTPAWPTVPARCTDAVRSRLTGRHLTSITVNTANRLQGREFDVTLV